MSTATHQRMSERGEDYVMAVTLNITENVEKSEREKRSKFKG